MDDPSTTSVTEGFGLMFYQSRFYDPALGRFTSADSIVPGGVQGLDRYAYVNNSPINYIDPSGHDAWWCTTAACQAGYYSNQTQQNVSFEVDDGEQWTSQEKKIIAKGAGDIAGALARQVNQNRLHLISLGLLDFYEPVTPGEAYSAVYGGPVTFRRVSGKCNCAAQTRSKNEIWVYSSTSSTYIPRHPGLVVHEMGHAFNNATNKMAQDVPRDLLRRFDANGVINHGNRDNFYYGYAGGWEEWQYGYQSSLPGSEELADMYLGWVYGSWNSDPRSLGGQRSNYMNSIMSSYLFSFIP